MSNYYDFVEVIKAVQGQIETIVRELFPEGKKKGSNWCVGNASGEKGQSFQISLNSANAGCFIDRADPSIKGNAIALVALRKNLNYQAAGEWLAKYCNIQPEERVFERKVKKKPEVKREDIQKLTKESIAYAAKRGITEDTLNALKCCSSRKNTDVILPHFTHENPAEPCLVKYWPHDGSKKMFSNKNPIHTLFGKHLIDPIKSGGTLIIAEGQWDAMTWIQLGYPAVSIPSGVSNYDWIEEDYIFLNQFTTIFLDFDNDEPGLDCENKVKVRLGYDRVRLIKYENFKDANELLQKGGDPQILIDAYNSAEEAPVEFIVKANNIKHSVKNHLTGEGVDAGIPFFISNLKKLRFRPHEATLWFGHTGHGKSTAIMNQFAFQAGQGIPGLIASFEDNTAVTYANILKQYTADATIGSSPDYDQSFDDLTNQIKLFDSMHRTRPDQIVSTFILAHKQLGISHFAIDNVMTMDVDRQDNTAQAAVADKLRVFVGSYPVHLHVAAHPRKAPEGHIVRPPQTQEVRGASEWADMTQNAVVVFRDVAKTERISQMEDEGCSPVDIMNYRKSCGDGKILVRKQRTTGDLPVCSFNFNALTKRFWKDQEDQGPYWREEEEEENQESEPF